MAVTIEDLNKFMGCQCDEPIVCSDAYFRGGTTMTTNYICTGCGKEISIDSYIVNIYDVEKKRHRRIKDKDKK